MRRAASAWPWSSAWTSALSCSFSLRSSCSAAYTDDWSFVALSAPRSSATDVYPSSAAWDRAMVTVSACTSLVQICRSPHQPIAYASKEKPATRPDWAFPTETRVSVRRRTTGLAVWTKVIILLRCLLDQQCFAPPSQHLTDTQFVT